MRTRSDILSDADKVGLMGQNKLILEVLLDIRDKDSITKISNVATRESLLDSAIVIDPVMTRADKPKRGRKKNEPT